LPTALVRAGVPAAAGVGVADLAGGPGAAAAPQRGGQGAAPAGPARRARRPPRGQRQGGQGNPARADHRLFGYPVSVLKLLSRSRLAGLTPPARLYSDRLPANASGYGPSPR